LLIVSAPHLFDSGVTGEATSCLLGEGIWSLNQLALHYPLLTFLFADLTQLGTGHQQVHFDLLPNSAVFARLGTKSLGGIVLRLVRDAAARCTLFWLEERQIKVRMGPCWYATAQTGTDVTRFNIPIINWHGAAL